MKINLLIKIKDNSFITLHATTQIIGYDATLSMAEPVSSAVDEVPLSCPRLPCTNTTPHGFS